MKYDYVARLETLDKDLNHLLPKLNSTDRIDHFPEKNVGAFDSKKYRSLYNDIPSSILQPVLDKYSVDADMFGYSFDDYFAD